MAIAHVCMQCGMALTRLRAGRDPHYRLPMVTCTNCGQACVRRRHPIQRRWRAFARAQTSVCALLLQILLLVALAAATVGSIKWIEQMVRRGPSIRYQLQHDGWLIAYTGILPAVLVGIWLTAGLSHWRRWWAWAAWGCLIACLLAIGPLLHSLGAPVVEVPRFYVVPGSFGLQQWLHRLAILGAIMVIATAGIPLGRGLRTAFARHRAHRWRKRRKRLRARRAGT